MLMQDDAAALFKELLPAQDESYMLGLKLGLSPQEVKSIHFSYTEPRYRLLQTLIEFTKKVEPAPTWRVIVEALRSPTVGLPALAERVEATHFPDSTSTREVLPEPVGKWPSSPLEADCCSY